MANVTLPRTDLFIGGRSVPAQSGGRFAVLDPSDETPVADVADAAVVDAMLALDAASGAFAEFSSTAPRARGEMLRRAFELMSERVEEIARLIVAENGKALVDARSEVSYAAEFFRWNAEEAVRIPGEVTTAPGGTNRILVLRQPIGVALLLTPWNFPAAMLTRKIAPALAAGCTVVCKPAEDTPLTALLLAEILHEAGAPPGVVNVIPTSSPASVTAALIADARIRKLSFTGSTEVGRLLLGLAAPRVLSCSMELGGNAPFIVFDDADLEAAVAGALSAKLRNGGEACTAANRFYVERGVADEFSRRFAAAMARLRTGSGLEEGVSVGPLINAGALAKVDGLVEGAKSQGARALIGGSPAGGAGFFYPPTVLADVPPTASILRDEIFGPVAPIVAFSGEDEAVALANDTEFGLVSYVYTNDLTRGLRVAERLESGMVGLNRGVVSDPAAPFGGVKQSGLGREGGSEGILEYLESKYIAATW